MKCLMTLTILLAGAGLAMAAAEKAPVAQGRSADSQAAHFQAATQTASASQEANQELSDEQIERRIQELRTAEVTLTVLTPAGEKLANAEVVVRQTRHQFLFGCNLLALFGHRSDELEQAYEDRFVALFNYGTLPFYWGSYERQEGKPAQDRMMKMAQWCQEHGIRPKGHPLLWNLSTPRWLEDKTPEQVEALQWGRITREVTTFAGKIDTWDVVNEATDMPSRDKDKPSAIGGLCRRLGAAEMIHHAFSLARQANPSATLILNDYEQDKEYDELIQQCLDEGTPIDAIGMQSHMHKGHLSERKVWDMCQRLGRFGKPVHWTEVTILSGKLMEGEDFDSYRPDWKSTEEGEARQAEQAVRFYRILFSHPAVQAITWWDLSDANAWLGAPAGLLRKDMSPKPAYEALYKLIKERWWTGPLKLKTNAQGQATFRGFLGDYVVEAAGAAGAFALSRQQPSLTVTVKPQHE